MAKYSIPDLTSEELSLLGSGAYTEEEILRRRERTAQRRAAREQEAKAYTPPPVEEAPLQEKPPSNLWGKTADVVGGAASELWPGIKSGYRGLLGGMAQGLADDPSQVIPSMMPPGTAALNRLFGGQSLEEKAADSIGLSDYLASSSRQLNESNAALNAAETKDIPQIPSGELGNVFDENPEGVGKYYGRQLGHSLGFMGPAIAAGVASRGKLVAPMVTMGLMTKASDYGEFRGKGASEEQASLASTGTGVLEGVLGAIPIGIATKPGTGLFKRAIGAALGEELTEIPTTIGQMATEEAAGITNYTTEDYIQGIRDTALIAGIPGAAGAVVAHPFSKKPASKDPAPFIAGQEMSNELERLVKEAKSKTPDMSKDIDMANSFVSLNLDDITKMPQFTMDLKGHKFQDNNMVQPIPTEVQATPQNRVDELQRQAKEEQLRNLGMPRLPDSVWEGGRQIEPVMPGPFQTQNAEPALQPDPLTGQAPAIPEMTFNNEFRPPSQLQGREVLGLKNYSEKTGVGTGPIGPANAPTEAPVQPEGMPEVPSQYQQSYTLPPFKQGYDLKLGKQTKQAETKASPAAEIKSLLDQLNRKPKLASSADTDMAILERQEDTDRFEQVIRKGNIQDAHTLADTLKGMLKSDRAKSMVNAFLSAGFLKNVQVRIADTEADLAMLETDNARALYQPAKDGAPAFILLAPSKAGPTRHGMSPDLVYHEIGHAVTYEMVEAARTGVETTPEIQSLYEQLDMLRQDVAANIDKMATNEAERQAIQNATSDVHEMISYTLTNQNFNKAASRFRVKGITVRQWIKNILSKLATKFGVSVKDANNMMDVLFDRALTAVQETAKYDPAKFEMRGKVDKETGTVDKRLVNKDTGKPLASEITTNPPVLYSQLEKLVNSKMSPKNATWRKWQEWLKSMQENGHLKQEELDAFYAYGDDHLYVPSDQIVSRDEVIEMVNRFDKRAFRMMQRGDTTIEDAPIDISEVKQRPMRDATKERLDDLLARHDLIDEVPDAENLIPEDEREAVAAYLKEKFPDMESHQETFRVLSDAAGLYYMDEEAAITSLKNLINKFDEYLRNFLPNFKGRGDLSVENMYLELENKAKGIISGTLPEYNARGRVALEEEVGNLQDLIGEGKGIMHEIATAKKARHRAEKEAYDFREQYSQEFLANEILVELGLIETGAFEEYTDTAYFESHTLPGGKDYGILGLTENNPNKNYRHPHFAEKNLIGWTRYKTRGNALALEEIQSDWNQWYNSPDRGRIKKKLEELADVKKELNELKEARRNYEAGNQPAAVHTLILLNYIPEGHRDAKLPHLGASILSFIKHTEANIEAIENALYVLKAENVRVQSDPANKPAISKDWSTTMFKLAIAEAVAKGLDYVAYTKGRVQAERWPVKDSNIPKMYDVTMKNSLNDYLKRYGSQVQDGATAEGWDDPTVSHGTKGTRYMKDDFWVFPITDSMRETVLTTGQPRFVKRDDTGRIVDEVAERRNRLQPDTTEVAEAEEITMESESQPSPDSAYDSKLKLYGNKASAGNVPVSQVASKLDKNNVRPIDVGVMDELLRSGSSAEVPLFDQETGREIGATTTGEGETVQELMGVEAREAANDSAEDPKPAAVKRPFESLPPDRSPAGWFVNVMRGLFKPTAIEGKTMGKETMVLVEAMNEYKGQQFYRVQQALNVLADSSDQKTMLLALEGDEEALKKLSADDAQAVSTIVNTIDMLQRAGVVHELASLKNPTEKDIAVAKKVVASILGDEKYRHRAYAKDIQKRGISTKWVADLLRNKDKKGSLWQNAKAHLIANELTIPTDFKSMGLPTLERMYAHWTGLNPEGKSKSELISSLEKFRNKSGPEIDAKAEELVKMLLDLTPTPGPGISRLYAGNKQDLTIVTPRSKIDEPIRKLWGEVEDPLAKIVVTVTKLIEFNARHRFLMNLYETGVKDGWIAEADDPKADPNLSVTLEGREFGPLDGMRVTPNVKSILDSVLKLEKDMEFGIQNNVFQGLGEKVGKKAVRFWERGLISPIKALMLTTNPKVWITNLLSGPGVLMANGNFTGAGGLTVIKNAWGLTNITKHKKWNPFTDKVISQGWMDSALFGELTNEQLSDYASAVADSVFTEDTRRNKFRKLSIAAKDKATGSKDVFRNMFALMDMGYKLMNGVNEANRLRAIHPDWSDEKVMAVASDRVKMTNYTRGRAIPVAKWADKKGLQFFATYMSEIGRTLGYNTMIGVSDVIAGSRDGNPKQIAHGMSRVIGVGLATMYYDQLLSFAVSGAGMLMGSALSILGEDDDEDRNEKARDIIGALPEDWRNQLLVPIAVTKDGKLQMQAADRFDFHGQWNSIFRAAAKVANGKEDWQFLANEVQNLFFMHSLVRNMLNPNPGRLQKIAPEAYETAYKFLTQTLPLSDSTANRIINTAMTADVPVIRTGLLPTINNMGKPASERQDVNWLGFNPIEYDPKLELVRGADRYNGSLSANRNELAKLIANTGTALDKPGLEKFYNSVLDEEISAFSELNAKVKGARAMGYNNSQIASILASQNVRRDYIPYVMHGKFVPRPFGDRYLQSAFIDTQFSDATPERKKALSNRLIQARAYLDQLRMEYMQNDRLN